MDTWDEYNILKYHGKVIDSELKKIKENLKNNNYYNFKFQEDL